MPIIADIVSQHAEEAAFQWLLRDTAVHAPHYDLKDLREQVEGMAAFTPDQVKLRFLNALDNEMQMLPELEGGGMFVVGQRSSTLTKGQFANLIELMFAYGAKHDVEWSRKSEDTIASVRQ